MRFHRFPDAGAPRLEARASPDTGAVRVVALATLAALRQAARLDLVALELAGGRVRSVGAAARATVIGPRGAVAATRRRRRGARRRGRRCRRTGDSCGRVIDRRADDAIEAARSPSCDARLQRARGLAAQSREGRSARGRPGLGRRRGGATRGLGSRLRPTAARRFDDLRGRATFDRRVGRSAQELGLLPSRDVRLLGRPVLLLAGQATRRLIGLRAGLIARREALRERIVVRSGAGRRPERAHQTRQPRQVGPQHGGDHTRGLRPRLERNGLGTARDTASRAEPRGRAEPPAAARRVC